MWNNLAIFVIGLIFGYYFGWLHTTKKVFEMLRYSHKMGLSLQTIVEAIKDK